jgi:Fe2+ or Zn2+ uptake regulation protein
MPSGHYQRLPHLSPREMVLHVLQQAPRPQVASDLYLRIRYRLPARQDFYALMHQLVQEGLVVETRGMGRRGGAVLYALRERERLDSLRDRDART